MISWRLDKTLNERPLSYQVNRLHTCCTHALNMVCNYLKLIVFKQDFYDRERATMEEKL